ncbi:hypothetical protein GGR50DRAFT_31903 [Xylaria sp. CBS 124048]|nr:hypothetical protein GGR50DRAFT_31903 [Xylaria sp. CBS 124048]
MMMVMSDFLTCLTGVHLCRSNAQFDDNNHDVNIFPSSPFCILQVFFSSFFPFQSRFVILGDYVCTSPAYKKAEMYNVVQRSMG